jgi:methylenetetrahydrofolate dehydrogenase (NADP+)/methenyltetrahydrofolate cyclohydrolase
VENKQIYSRLHRILIMDIYKKKRRRIGMAVVLSGKEVAEYKKKDIRRRVEQLKSKGIKPALNIVMVGDRKDSLAYVEGARKALGGCDIECRVSNYPEAILQEDLIKKIQSINQDENIHGVLIMRPLPDSIDWETVGEIISPAKDVDCVTPYNLSGVFRGYRNVFHPCTAQAVLDVLEYYGVNLEGKKVAVIGRSLVVGKPVAMMLLQKNATVTICHSRTVNLKEMTSSADILVAAAGKPRLIGKEYVKQDAVVVDVGINVVDGKLVGDVNFEEVKEKASMITPVPGGVGTVTTAVLMEHIVAAAGRML